MELILYSSDNDIITLDLSSSEKMNSSENILNTQKAVFEDKTYGMEVDLPEGETPVMYQIDDEQEYFSMLGSDQNDGKIRYDVKSLFKGKIGIVQISLEVRTDTGRYKIYYSEYASVLIPSNETNEQIEMMLDYIYDNQPDFLFRPQKISETGVNSEDNGDNSFWSQIQLIEDIASVYESLYGYFKANRRYLLKPVKQVDDTDKLQYIEAETIQHMAQHPEYLHKSLNGFRYGSGYFLPDKVLMTKNMISYDTYENRLIISFLRKIDSETKRLSEKISDYISSIPDSSSPIGYIVSFSLLFKVAVDALKEYKEALSGIEERVSRLLSSYQRLFDFRETDELMSCPRPTPVMRSVPQYNIIYSYMVKWFSRKGYEFRAEDIMMRFFNLSSVYEIYVLVKLIRTSINVGFTFSESYKKDYGLRESRYYHNYAYNNAFVFQRNGVNLSIFYSPVIYNGFATRNDDISLYRSSSLSYNNASDSNSVNRRGSYYVPDYVIKIDHDGQEKYIICDAKYKKLYNVRAYDIPALGYKYLLSISPSKANASLVGLDIFYGKTEDHLDAESIYDSCGDVSTSPQYMYMLTPLSEGVPVKNQMRSLRTLIGNLL